MNQRLIKAKSDPITLGLATFWIVAAAWTFVAHNVLSEAVFFFAFGFNMGNALRLYSTRVRSDS